MADLLPTIPSTTDAMTFASVAVRAHAVKRTVAYSNPLALAERCAR
jgi:hypothetical protein